MDEFTLDELKQTQRALDYFLANFDLTTSEKHSATSAYNKLDESIDLLARYEYYLDRKPVSEVESADEAEDIAKDWQNWVSDQSLSQGEFADWEEYFTELGEKFELMEVFKENGIC